MKLPLKTVYHNFLLKIEIKCPYCYLKQRLLLTTIGQYYKNYHVISTTNDETGGGGCQLVSVVTFYSEDLSLNPPDF